MGFRCWLLVITFVLSMGFHCELAEAHGQRQPLQSPEAADDGVCTAVVNPQGYECQEYEVVDLLRPMQVKTQDGYILTMHRIPQARGGGSAGKRQPVLLQHGVLMVRFREQSACVAMHACIVRCLLRHSSSSSSSDDDDDD
ncbi:hypothetical protein GW17_00056868 [Ensete ventricosum]|nr:hypothetical protein GW17_00056868 [Ensete ventricosum]